MEFCIEGNDIIYIRNIKLNYGFKSIFLPNLNTDLKDLEENMFNLFKNINFIVIKYKLKYKLKNYINSIKKSKSIFGTVDKTNNYQYKLSNDEYTP